MSEFDPGDHSASIVSVTDQVRPLKIGMPVTSVHFLGDNAAFVGAEESVFLVGGDDGKLIALDVKGEVTLLATDPKRRWIDNVALHPDGAVAWSAGKTAFIRAGKAEEKSLDVPSTVGALAFAPKGLRLAVAHYNGATLSI